MAICRSIEIVRWLLMLTYIAFSGVVTLQAQVGL
jgi:hypothetical protein